MKENMSNTDKAIRIVLAVGIAILYYAGLIKDTLSIVLLCVAGFFLLTSFFGFCPLYRLFGITSLGKQK